MTEAGSTQASCNRNVVKQIRSANESRAEQQNGAAAQHAASQRASLRFGRDQVADRCVGDLFHRARQFDTT